MRAWVEYNVPVLALVDTDSGEVERVVQVDEETRASGLVFVVHEEGGPGDELVSATEGQGNLRAKAIATAEDGEWPAWEAGF